jgi:CAAD domains of cyanobacterial aminoacyl-tRNA synthetase
MEPELKEKNAVINAVTGESRINTEVGGSLTPFTISDSDDPTEQLKAYANQAMNLLSNLPESLGNALSTYRSQLVTLGLIFSGFLGVKLTFALLSALNEIPLVQPALELVGLLYTVWFAYRFIVKADNRDELSEKYGSLKSQVFGKK